MALQENSEVIEKTVRALNDNIGKIAKVIKSIEKEASASISIKAKEISKLVSILRTCKEKPGRDILEYVFKMTGKPVVKIVFG